MDLSLEVIAENKKLTLPVRESNKSRISGKLRYWWCWFVAGALLLVVAVPALIFLWIINRRTWLYPLALWGARVWLNACGAKIVVKGTEISKKTARMFSVRITVHIWTLPRCFATQANVLDSSPRKSF